MRGMETNRLSISKRSGALRLAGAAVLLSLGLAATAIAASSASPGAYRASGHIAFRFRLTKGFCYLAPKNLHNYRARRGKGGTGVCFSSISSTPLHYICTGGSSLRGAAVDFSLFDRLRLSGGRTLHVKAYTYGSAPAPVGFTELDLAFSGSRATGFVRATTQVGNANGGTNSCDTGKLQFSARAG
jgi:hypothetical protein